MRLIILKGGLYDSMTEGSFRSLPVASVPIVLFFYYDVVFFFFICVTCLQQKIKLKLKYSNNQSVIQM